MVRMPGPIPVPTRAHGDHRGLGGDRERGAKGSLSSTNSVAGSCPRIRRGHLGLRTLQPEPPDDPAT